MTEAEKLVIVINGLLALFTLATAIAAAFSAVAAKRAARETHLATQGQLMNQLFDSYAARDMLEAMIELRRWVTQRGEAFADDYRKLRRENYDKVRGLDEARRQVAHYFEKIYAMWSSGALDESITRAVASRGQIEFLREVIEPLEEAVNPDYERTVFDALGSLYNIPKHSRPVANP